MTDRREFLGAMMAIFTGVVLPEPVREQLVIAPDSCLYQVVVHLPVSTYSPCLGTPYIPSGVGATTYSAMATVAELTKIKGQAWGSDLETRQLIRRVIARPYDASKPFLL